MPTNLFKPGNTIGKAGRPRGSRNKLASQFLDDLIEIWNEPIKEGSELRRGPAALRIMSRERPNEFVKVYGACLPKELHFENVTTDWDDDELRRTLEYLREQLRADTVLSLPNMKTIDHAN